MRDTFALIAMLSVSALIAGQSPAFAAAKTQDNPNGCQIIQRSPHDRSSDNSGTLSSSVTAGNGRVSGSSSAGGGSVTVHSGSGSSVATAGSTGGGGTTAMVASGDGGCTIYVDPGDRKEP